MVGESTRLSRALGPGDGVVCFLGGSPGCRIGIVETKPEKREYSEDQKMDALAVLALYNGNKPAASQETGISPNTLGHWAYKTRRKEYAEIRKRLQGELREASIEKYKNRAEEAGKAADDIRGEMMLPKNLKDIPARDLPGAYRNAATAAGIFADKAMKLEEQITGPPPAPRQLDQIMKGLAAKGVKVKLEISSDSAPVPKAESPAIEGEAVEASS